ncbi:hypothetical protein KKC97_12505 [bacterium]|nr:hypothetical protein [bacterium]MBU1638478.1 hypothetical protein [bacterium]MBU1920373.1 hypothetical protein [bacterium]
MNLIHCTFKSCSMCHNCWNDIESFIEDRTLELNGYQADFEDPAKGLILVTHRVDGCHSTISVPAGKFAHLYTGPVYKTHNTGKPSCTGKCLNDKDYSACPAECDMHWVREILQCFKKHSCTSSAETKE